VTAFEAGEEGDVGVKVQLFSGTSAFENPSVKSQTIYSITKIYAKSSNFEQERRKTKRERGKWR
jgi:hypothetical protein